MFPCNLIYCICIVLNIKSKSFIYYIVRLCRAKFIYRIHD